MLKHVRDYVKDSIRWCKANPHGAYAGAGAALLLFPGPRNLVFRSLFGAFQSQESAFRAASERFSATSEAATTLLKGKAETMEAATAALEALTAARTRAAAARSNLEGLTSQMESLEHKYEGACSAVPKSHSDRGSRAVARRCLAATASTRRSRALDREPLCSRVAQVCKRRCRR